MTNNETKILQALYIERYPDEYVRARRLDQLVDTNQHIAAFFVWAAKAG